MEHISLLPIDYQNKKQSRRTLGILTVATGIIAGVLVFTLVILRILSSIPESELKALKAENQLLQNEINELMKLKTIVEDIKKQRSLVDKAIGNQPDWLVVFSLVGADLPEGLTITSINAGYNEKASVLNIQGRAFGHDDVAQWMESLRESDYVSNISLEYSRMQSAERPDAISFEMSITIKGEKFKLFSEVAYD